MQRTDNEHAAHLRKTPKINGIKGPFFKKNIYSLVILIHQEREYLPPHTTNRELLTVFFSGAFAHC
jgi:hypothetical protein